MNRTSRWAARVAITTIAAIAVTSCTRPENELAIDASTASTIDVTAGEDDTDVTSPTSEAPPTSPPPTSSPAPTSSVANGTTTTTAPATTPTTTTIAAPSSTADLTLIFDGVSPYRFGDRDVDVVPKLAAILGEPVRDELTEYPDAVNGVFLDETGEATFIAPFGRTVCYAEGLCVQFGAGAPETLIFSGWSLDDRAGPNLVTDDGLAIGATLAEHRDVITFDPLNSCYQVGFADAGGISVTLLSDDGVFAAPTADGNGVDVGDPDPALVTIIGLSAGQLPGDVHGDC